MLRSALRRLAAVLSALVMAAILVAGHLRPARFGRAIIQMLIVVNYKMYL